ncbi:YHS domain-containing protein, partial [archaeon]|nr:YHS domain-containing protein [archaeon]
MAIDPICKMTVDEETAEFTTEHDGQTYYFCAPGCKAAFEEDPAKYLGGESGESGSHKMPEEPKEAPSKAEKKPFWKF